MGSLLLGCLVVCWLVRASSARRWRDVNTVGTSGHPECHAIYTASQLHSLRCTFESLGLTSFCTSRSTTATTSSTASSASTGALRRVEERRAPVSIRGSRIVSAFIASSMCRFGALTRWPCGISGGEGLAREGEWLGKGDRPRHDCRNWWVMSVGGIVGRGKSEYKVKEVMNVTLAYGDSIELETAGRRTYRLTTRIEARSSAVPSKNRPTSTLQTQRQLREMSHGLCRRWGMHRYPSAPFASFRAVTSLKPLVPDVPSQNARESPTSCPTGVARAAATPRSVFCNVWTEVYLGRPPIRRRDASRSRQLQPFCFPAKKRATLCSFHPETLREQLQLREMYHRLSLPRAIQWYHSPAFAVLRVQSDRTFLYSEPNALNFDRQPYKVRESSCSFANCIPDSPGVEESNVPHTLLRGSSRSGRSWISTFPSPRTRREFASPFHAGIASAATIPRTLSQTVQVWAYSMVLPTAHGGASRTGTWQLSVFSLKRAEL